MTGLRVHIKNAKDMKEFLIKNRKTFRMERTSTGFPTVHYNNIEYYVRDKALQRSFLNKILKFQTDVSNSGLYKFVNKKSKEAIIEESERIEKTLMYKGFTHDPQKDNLIYGAVKIDLNVAYWQTCKVARLVTKMTYDDIMLNCLKQYRLRLTGSLGKKILVTEYTEGLKTNFYIKDMPKKRVVFQNIYNRIRKFVDELMVFCWRRNPDNFIGYYTDCFWLKEYDFELIEMIRRFYEVKMDVVTLSFINNSHKKMVIQEIGTDSMTVYDGRYKPEEFVMYENFYNFTSHLRGTKLKISW